MRPFLSLLLTFFITCTASAQTVQWEETNFSGKPLIQGIFRHVASDASGKIYAVLENGPKVIVSTNAGNSWAIKELPSSAITGLAVLAGKFYLGTDQGLLSSTDFETWNPVTLPATGKITFLESEKGVLIIRTSTQKCIYSSFDGSQFFVVPPDFTVTPAVARLSNDDLLFISPLGIWKTKVGTGEYTTLATTGLTTSDITVLRDTLYAIIGKEIQRSAMDVIDLKPLIQETSPAPKRLYSINDVLVVSRGNQLHHSFDGMTLVPSFGIFSYDFLDLTFLPNGDYLASTMEGIFTSNDHADTWKRITRSLDTTFVTELVSLGNKRLLAATNKNEILLTTDAGNTWELRNKMSDTVTMLGVTPAGTVLIGVPGNLFASIDLAHTFLGTQGFESRTPNCMVVGRGEKIYLGTDSGMFFSTDDGARWFMPKSFLMNILSGNSFLPPVYSMAIDSSNRLYVGTDKGVVLSLDEGENYESGWLRRSLINALQATADGGVVAGSTHINIEDTSRSNFYHGWDVLHAERPWLGIDREFYDHDFNVLDLNSKHQIISGMMFSFDWGTTWVRSAIEGVGTPRAVYAQAIDENDVVYVAFRDKVYRTAGPLLSAPVSKTNPSQSIVYPNPAISAIRFQQEGNLSIFDALGNERMTASVVPGEPLDITALPNGAYICRITTQSGAFTAPLVISR